MSRARVARACAHVRQANDRPHDELHHTSITHTVISGYKIDTSIIHTVISGYKIDFRIAGNCEFFLKIAKFNVHPPVQSCKLLTLKSVGFSGRVFFCIKQEKNPWVTLGMNYASIPLGNSTREGFMQNSPWVTLGRELCISSFA